MSGGGIKQSHAQTERCWDVVPLEGLASLTRSIDSFKWLPDAIPPLPASVPEDQDQSNQSLITSGGGRPVILWQQRANTSVFQRCFS